MRFLSVRLSVCPSVRLSNACIVTKRKKNLSGFLYHAKDHSVLQRFELQLFETKIITHEKVQSDDKRVMGRPNEQTVFAEHAGAVAIDSEKPPAEPLLH